MNTNTNIDELIQNHLLGKISEEEAKILHDWILESPENKKEFLVAKDVYDTVQGELIKDEFNFEKAFESFNERIGKKNSETKVVTLGDIQNKNKKVLNIARYLAVASLVPLVFLFYTLINKKNIESVVISNYDLKVVYDTLSDNSVVSLSLNSKIKLDKNYGIKNRNLELEGKAFFNVTKNADMPFVIETKGLLIEVVGTSFQVDTKHSATEEEIIVESGKLKVKTLKAADTTYFIEKGVSLIYNSENQSVKLLNNNDVNYNSWKTGMLYFHNTPLSKVFNDMEIFYNVAIDFDSIQIKNLNFTANFGNQPIESVLESIEMVYNVDIIQQTNGDYKVNYIKK